MGSNPLEQSFLVACSHDPPWLLLARWLAAAPLLNRHGSHRGAEGQPCFPLDYLYSPSDTQMQDGQGRAGHPQRPPGRGEVTQILLEQGLARMGYRWEAARLGLAEEQLPNVAWDLRSLLLGSQQGRPGRSAGSCVVAPRSDHFHQSGRDRSLRCKAKSRLQGWMPKGGYGAWRGGRGGLHLPLTCGGGALGAATQRGTKPALGSGAYKPPDRHSSATRDTHTHTRTGPRSALPGGHRRRRRGGQEEVGVKALAWHQAEPPRPGAPWAVAEGRSRRALPHRLLPLTAARDAARGHGGQRGPPRSHITPPTHLSKSPADCEEN